MKTDDKERLARKAAGARWMACSGVLLALLAVSGAFAQQGPQFGGPPFSQGQMQDPMSPTFPGDNGNLEMQTKRLEALNALRQKSLVSDTNKLVKIAAQLNAEINGAHPHSLTPEQYRMVAEIEKLAHSIREKMVTPVNGIPQMAPPAPIMPPGIP